MTLLGEVLKNHTISFSGKKASAKKMNIEAGSSYSPKFAGNQTFSSFFNRQGSNLNITMKINQTKAHLTCLHSSFLMYFSKFFFLIFAIELFNTKSLSHSKKLKSRFLPFFWYWLDDQVNTRRMNHQSFRSAIWFWQS